MFIRNPEDISVIAKGLLLTGFIFFIVLIVSSDGIAVIYKYTDKNGVISFADDLQSVPPQYRITAKIVSGEEKEEKNIQENQKQQNALQEIKNVGLSSKRENTDFLRNDKNSPSSKLLVSVVVIVSVFFIFATFRIMGLNNKKPIAIARVAIFCSASVYLLYAHSGDVIGAVRSIESKIESVQQTAEEKGKKAARTLKAVNTLVEHAAKLPTYEPEGREEKEK